MVTRQPAAIRAAGHALDDPLTATVFVVPVPGGQPRDGAVPARLALPASARPGWR